MGPTPSFPPWYHSYQGVVVLWITTRVPSLPPPLLIQAEMSSDGPCPKHREEIFSVQGRASILIKDQLKKNDGVFYLAWQSSGEICNFSRRMGGLVGKSFLHFGTKRLSRTPEVK